MSVLQVWLVAGIPALVFGLIMFVGHSPLRALFGYVFLAAGFAFVTSVDRASGAAFAGLLALLYASGRGGAMENQPQPGGHEARDAGENPQSPEPRRTVTAP